MTYHVVIVGSNCAAWAERSVKSAAMQRPPKACRVRVHVGLDGPVDGTEKVIRFAKMCTDHWTENRGAAYSRWRVLTSLKAGPEDVVVLMDLDDYLPHKDVIRRVHEEYERGADLTYGSYEFEGGGSWEQPPYPSGAVDFRSHAFRCWSLRTFKFRLFDPDPARYVMDGEWIRKGTDVALMLPILERSERAVHIPDVLYVYNHDHPNVSRKKVDKSERTKVMQWIRAQ